MAGKKGMKKKGGMKYSKRPNPMQEGEGFLDVVKDVAGKANKFLKDTKLLSTIAEIIPPQTPYIGRVAQVGAPVLKSLGYGAKMRGRGKNQLVGVPNMVGGGDGPIGLTSVMSGKGKTLPKLNF